VPWRPRDQKSEAQFLSPEDIQHHAESRPDSDDEEPFSEQAGRDGHGQPRNRLYNRARLTDRNIDELLGLCKGIIADGVVSIEEARSLAHWMEANRETANQWPASVLYTRIHAMLADGILDPAEQTELFDLLGKMTSGGVPPGQYVNLSTSLPLTTPAPTVYFENRFFCMTGKFIYGPRQQCESAILARGGKVQERPTTDTHYLVIGVLGSSDWIHSTHGRKIEHAVEMRERGHRIAIISEDQWRHFL
jgi:NAD-dependent DNA ligase